MQTRPFQQVDVFTATPYLGNPVAVVLDGTGLDDAQMQAFARWTNLSETTFVLTPTESQADYHLRIFTPGGELAFAGHPTLGSCHAWLQAGGVPKDRETVLQQCGVGLVQIRRTTDMLAFGAPALRRSDPDTELLASVAGALGIQTRQIAAAQWLDNGTAWLGLLLDGPAAVLNLAPDLAALKRLGHKVGVAGVYPPAVAGAYPQGVASVYSQGVAGVYPQAQAGSNAPGLEVRGFAPHLGVDEDPVTGSLNASLAQWLIADGHMPQRYLAAQGACLRRAGRVSIQRDAAGQVWVGGRSVTCIAGTVTL